MNDIPRENRQQVIDQFCSVYPTYFFELLTEIEGEPLVLEDYQIAYLLDQTPFKITNKTRQAGASLIVSAAKFFKAYTNEYYRCDIVSVNLREAKDKIKYVKNLWSSLPVRWKHPLYVDNQYGIAFHSSGTQSEINSIAASSGVRGGKKDVVFDEAAHIMNFNELYVAALPATIRGQGGFDVISTPLGQTGKYYEIYTNHENDYDEYSRHFFGWWDVSFFCSDMAKAKYVWEVEMQKNISLMPELVNAFAAEQLKKYYKSLTQEEFNQEFCGAFVDESTAFYPWELINRCRKHSEAQPKPNGDLDTYNVLPEWFDRPKDNDNVVMMGIDFAEGRTGGDETSIQIVEKTEDGLLKLRFSADLSGPNWNDFDRQLKYIGELILKFRPQQVSCDETGLGRKIAQDLKKAHGSIVEPVTFTNANKEQMALNIKDLLEKQKLWLPHDNSRLAGQIHNLKRSYIGSLIRYSGDPHDDMFWALALACKGQSRGGFRIMTIDDPT